MAVRAAQSATGTKTTSSRTTRDTNAAVVVVVAVVVGVVTGVVVGVVEVRGMAQGAIEYGAPCAMIVLSFCAVDSQLPPLSVRRPDGPQLVFPCSS